MNISLVPQWPAAYGGGFFENLSEYDPRLVAGSDRLLYRRMKDQFESNGHSFKVIDQMGVERTDIAIFVGFRSVTDYYHELVKQDPTPTMVFIAREPPVYTAQHAEKQLTKLRSLFDQIFTWNDTLSDLDGFTKYHWPIAAKQLNRSVPDVPFHDRKLMTTISSMTSSEHPNELYSERERLISFYEQSHPEDFTLYGQNWGRPINGIDVCEGRWEVPNYSVYDGEIERKVDAYAQHKFALVFENQTGINGWISEKPFDAFASGRVPVYWGASNVADHLPSDTYIDYRKFDSPETLHEYLSSMDQSTYREYIEAITQYLQDGVGNHQIDNVVNKFYETIMDLVEQKDGSSKNEYMVERTTLESDSTSLLVELRDAHSGQDISYSSALSEFILAIADPPCGFSRDFILKQFSRAAYHELFGSTRDS